MLGIKGANGSDSAVADARDARMSKSLSGTNLARAGDYNLRTVLQAIRLKPRTTRTAIALQTGLTTQTIANITTRLAHQGLVQVTGRRQGVRGQPPLELEVVADGAFAIGLNVDRDHLTLVTLDLAGKIRSRVTRELAFPLPGDVLAFVEDELDQAIATGGLNRDRILGVGVAIPDDLGNIDLPNRPPNYNEWSNADLVNILKARLPWPVRCDNDAAAAALGETEYGTAYDNPTFFYLLISAGLGGGVVIDRSYHRGAHARSGEIGLMPDLGAGHLGAVIQDTVSLSALLARLETNGHKVADIAAIADLEGEAEEIVRQWLNDAVRALVQPLVAINCLLDPDAILIGGRLPKELIERLVEGLDRAISNLGLPSCAKIMPAIMAQDGPAVGAAILPFLDQLLPSDAILIQAGR